MCWIVSVLICFYLLKELFNEENINNLKQYPNKTEVIVTRFICGLVLHMNLQEEIKAGFNYMKFALNHHYRFSNYKNAFFAGFLQVTSVLIIEFTNALLLLGQQNVLDVVTNFMVIAVIAQFDDFFYFGLGDDDLKELIDNPIFDVLYTIKRTTSKNAGAKIPANKLEDNTFRDENDAVA